METKIAPGLRCRSNRTIIHPGGVLRHAAEGTVVSLRENIGRQLVTVNFDSGETLILFAHEVDAPTEHLAA
jgi:hypothetical protein